jgi:hypothetical protein
VTKRARAKPWWAPVIVAALAIVGAHPFCNAMFHCGCSMLGLTAHCNIHAPAPPHCPWCAQPAWFALAAVFALAGGAIAMRLVRRKTPATLPSVAVGLAGVVAGGWLGAVVTKLAR